MVTSEEKRVIREAIWKLAYEKQDCWQHVLQPAGVPWELVAPYFRKLRPLLNPTTGKSYTKREAGSLIIQAIEEQSDGEGVLRKLVTQIACFDKFHLSAQECDARAVVEKAKDLLPAMDARVAEEERAAAIIAARIEQQRRLREEEDERRRQEALATRRQLLLAEYDEMHVWNDHQKRGIRLEYIIQSLFELCDIPARKPFTRNEAREQIDGGLEWKGRYILVQVKWQKEPVADDEIEYARSQIRRSGADALLFLAVNGWTSSVIPLLKQNPEKDTLLMDGYELRSALVGDVSMRTAVQRKLDALKYDSEPFIRVIHE